LRSLQLDDTTNARRKRGVNASDQTIVFPKTANTGEVHFPPNPTIPPRSPLISSPGDSVREPRHLNKYIVTVSSIEYDLTPAPADSTPQDSSSLGLQTFEDSRKLRNSEAVRAVLLKHIPVIQDLYGQARKKTPDLTGQVTIRFVIDAQGHLISAELFGPSLLPAEFTTNLLNKMLGWRDFDPIKAGESRFRLTYKFGY
jgi:hypothetical protein